MKINKIMLIFAALVALLPVECMNVAPIIPTESTILHVGRPNPDAPYPGEWLMEYINQYHRGETHPRYDNFGNLVTLP